MFSYHYLILFYFFSAFWGALLLSIIYIILEAFVIQRNIRILKSHDYERDKNIRQRTEKSKVINAQIIDVEEIKDDKK